MSEIYYYHITNANPAVDFTVNGVDYGAFNFLSVFTTDDGSSGSIDGIPKSSWNDYYAAPAGASPGAYELTANFTNGNSMMYGGGTQANGIDGGVLTVNSGSFSGNQTVLDGVLILDTNVQASSAFSLTNSYLDFEGGTGGASITFNANSTVKLSALPISGNNTNFNGLTMVNFADGDGIAAPTGYTFDTSALPVYTAGSPHGTLTFTLIDTSTGAKVTVALSMDVASGTSPNFSYTTDSKGDPVLAQGTYVVCYLRGTRVLSPTGQMAVEDVKAGDLLVTRFGGIRPVKWIGRQIYGSHVAQNPREVAPVRIHAGALGDNQPARDLYVSPGHSMLVDGQLLLARLLVNGVTITQETRPGRNSAPVEYFQIDFETHDCILAEGAWSESFADGPGLRDRFHNAAEFYARNPSYRPPEELTLCAPRPEAGLRLEAALRPVAAQAAALVVPGKLRGRIEIIALPWMIIGWAQDEDHPDLPMFLEVLLDGKPLGTVLAFAYRQDLFKAGLGRGQGGFRWAAPVTLPYDAKDRLHIRRVADGAVLPGSAPLPQPERSLLCAVD